MSEGPGAAVRCWVLTDGRASMENQCLGLAEALEVAAEPRRVHPRAPWKFLPPGLWPVPFRALGADSDPLDPPWPDLLIAAGRRTVALSVAVRRASGGRTFTVQIERPEVPSERFDLVVPPRHDRLSGPNVVPTVGAIHRITPERLAEAAAHFGPRFAHLPRPLVAVLVGGTNRRYRMTPKVMDGLCDGLARLAGQGCGIVVTASRRTGPQAEAVLRTRLAALPGAELWDGTGENPYRGYLALADHIVVTCDSVAMASEAAATGKPVHVVRLEGDGGKFERFHAHLRELGITRPFTGELAEWHYEPLDDAATVAAVVRRALISRGVVPGPAAPGGDRRRQSN